MNQCAELNNTNCVLSYTSIGDPASNGSWQLSEYSPLHPLPLGRLVKAAALGGQSSIPSQTVWYPEPLDLNRLLLLLAPVVLADPAIAFDGGGFEAEEKIAVPNLFRLANGCFSVYCHINASVSASALHRSGGRQRTQTVLTQ